MGAGQAAGKNCEVPSILRVCYGRNTVCALTQQGSPSSWRVSPVCPQALPPAPPAGYTILLIVGGRGPGTFKGRQPEGGACRPKWAGMGRAHRLCPPHKGSALHSCQDSAEAAALRLLLLGALSAPGICEEGRLSSLCCEEADSETRSECVGSHDASSGLILVSGMQSFRKRSLWALKDLRVG